MSNTSTQTSTASAPPSVPAFTVPSGYDAAGTTDRHRIGDCMPQSTRPGRRVIFRRVNGEIVCGTPVKIALDLEVDDVVITVDVSQEIDQSAIEAVIMGELAAAYLPKGGRPVRGDGDEPRKKGVRKTTTITLAAGASLDDAFDAIYGPTAKPAPAPAPQPDAEDDTVDTGVDTDRADRCGQCGAATDAEGRCIAGCDRVDAPAPATPAQDQDAPKPVKASGKKAAAGTGDQPATYGPTIRAYPKKAQTGATGKVARKQS